VSKFRVNSLSIVYHCAKNNLPALIETACTGRRQSPPDKSDNSGRTPGRLLAMGMRGGGETSTRTGQCHPRQAGQ